MKAAIHSLGCKVNTYEAQQMAEQLSSNGFDIVDFNEISDIYIINTCSVTNIADHKSRQMLHRARALNPDAIIVAAGCYANTHERSELTDKDIDIVVLNEEKKNIADILKRYLEAGQQNAYDIPEPLAKSDDFSWHERTRIFLKVQDGCNMFCSYCIIPYARGRIQSPPISELVETVKGYSERGYHEFVLTGIHLSSYGKDRPDSGEDLISLIEALSMIEGVDRIRLGSLEPRTITEDFVKRLTKIPELCPHFHLSLQSGSDSVLKRMNRHYTTQEYYDSVCMLRQAFYSPAITTDVIVGFPGETEAEFEETVSFLEKVCFYETHIFKYSRRRGTVADGMSLQLTNAQKVEREKILLKMTEERKRKFADHFIGAGPVEVLFEENNEGYTREYVRVRCISGKVSEGRILRGRITGRINNDIMEFRQDG